MKKIKFIYLLALVALLLNVSCAKDDEPALSGDKVMVQFTAQLPGYIDSRAIGDGKKANELFFWVYDENNHELRELHQHNIAFNNQGTATVQVPLTPGHTYSFAFWAQNKDCKVYDTSNSDVINIDYFGTDENPVLSNDDYRDAFYALAKNIEVSAEGQTVQRRITLRRPFAQLNYGISHDQIGDAFQAMKDAGYDLTGATTRVYVSNAYMHFGLLEGKPVRTDDFIDIYFEFNMNDIPNRLIRDVWYQPDPDDPDAGQYRDYVSLAFNYFLTKMDGELIDTYIEIELADGRTLGPFEFSNVRVAGNNRTNILSDFMLSDAKFNVIIDQNFDDYDNNVDLVTYTPISPSQLLTLNDPAGNYMVNGNGEELVVNAPTTIRANNLVVNNVTLKSEGLANNASPFIFATRDLCLNGVDFEGTVSGSTDVVIVSGNQAKSVTIENCEFNTSGIYNAIYIDNTPNLQNVYIKNVDFTSVNRNNAITVGATTVNATINIEGCNFAAVSNAVRLFNTTNSTGVGLVTKDCTCQQWETGQYAGFFIFEDPQSATADEANSRNVFGPDKVTVTIDNVTGPNGLISFTNPKDGAWNGTVNANQTYYVYYHQGGLIPYGDGARYPKFIFK